VIISPSPKQEAEIMHMMRDMKSFVVDNSKSINGSISKHRAKLATRILFCCVVDVMRDLDILSDEFVDDLGKLLDKHLPY
jgi:hypothetical protein